MSRDKKLELIAALEEKARRSLLKRDNFIPNAGQAPVIGAFVDPNIETILVLTGNGGGKTALGTNLAIDSARGFVRHTQTKLSVPSRVIVVLDKPEKVDKVWLPEIKKWYALEAKDCHKNGKPYITEISFENGSEIFFMFHDQDPMSFESVEGDVFIFDEPPPRHVFIALRRAGRKKNRKPKYMIIGTPIAAPWLRIELYEPWAKGERPEIACFRFSTEVNRVNLSDGYIESFSKYLTDKEKRIRLEGEFFDLDGLALAHLFRRDTHLIKKAKWNPAWPVIVAIDPHPQKAHVAIMLGVDPHNRLTYLKEIRLKATPRSFAAKLMEFYDGYRVMDIVCDDFGSGEMTGGEGFLSFIEVLRDCGIRVRPTRWKDKHDDDWVQRLQDNLIIPEDPDQFGQKRPRLQIVADCYGIIENIENAQWVKMRNHDEFKPTLDIRSKDFLACLKYALAASPRFSNAREAIIRPKTASPWSSASYRPNRGDDEPFGEF